MESNYVTSNQEVAILMRLNELAERWGLRPYDFYACLDSLLENGLQVLDFEIGPKEPEKKDRFLKMLAQLQISASDWHYEGTTKQIIDLLDRAIQVAPSGRILS